MARLTAHKLKAFITFCIAIAYEVVSAFFLFQNRMILHAEIHEFMFTGYKLLKWTRQHRHGGTRYVWSHPFLWTFLFGTRSLFLKVSPYVFPRTELRIGLRNDHLATNYHVHNNHSETESHTRGFVFFVLNVLVLYNTNTIDIIYLIFQLPTNSHCHWVFSKNSNKHLI